MGKFVRSLLVILLTSVGMVAAPALAARPTKKECTRACSEFASELTGNSTASVRLNNQQRAKAIGAIQRLVQQCIDLCGLSIVMPSTLGGLENFLVESNSSSGKSSSTPAPLITPTKTVAPPVATSIPGPVATATPFPTFAATAVPSFTLTPVPGATGLPGDHTYL